MTPEEPVACPLVPFPSLMKTCRTPVPAETNDKDVVVYHKCYVTGMHGEQINFHSYGLISIYFFSPGDLKRFEGLLRV